MNSTSIIVTATDNIATAITPIIVSTVSLIASAIIVYIQKRLHMKTKRELTSIREQHTDLRSILASRGSDNQSDTPENRV